MHDERDFLYMVSTFKTGLLLKLLELFQKEIFLPSSTKYITMAILITIF